MATPVLAPKIVPPAVGSLAHFSQLAEQLRDFAAQAEAMANSIESAALSIEERVERAQAGSDKLRQLKTLLAEIS